MNLISVDIGDIVVIQGEKFRLVEFSPGLNELPPKPFFQHIPDDE